MNCMTPKGSFDKTHFSLKSYLFQHILHRYFSIFLQVGLMPSTKVDLYCLKIVQLYISGGGGGGHS